MTHHIALGRPDTNQSRSWPAQPVAGCVDWEKAQHRAQGGDVGGRLRAQSTEHRAHSSQTQRSLELLNYCSDIGKFSVPSIQV